MKIEQLTLLSNDLVVQKEFYHKKLGFEILEDKPQLLSVKIGKSKLNFKYSESEVHYHFAFNIPRDAITHALAFFKPKIDLVSANGTTVMNFNHWNAKAIFFNDGNGNLAEFIARSTCDPMDGNDFNIDMVKNISEIGIPVSDIEPIFEAIHRNMGLDVYDGGIHRFCAIGNEEGLFICINKDNKTWYPIDKKAIPSPFEALVSYRDLESLVTFDGLKMTIEDFKT